MGQCYKKEGEKMIQYPINVTPQDQAVDATGNIIFSYTFQGDYQSERIIRIYDYDSDELVHQKFASGIDRTPMCYNNNKSGYTIPANTLTNGHKYVAQICLIQRTLDGLDFLTDMPVFGGKTVNGSTGGVVYIDGEITSIYPWNNVSGEFLPTTIDNNQITNMSIKINGEVHNITSYKSRANIGDVDYGIIALDSPFTFNITEGMDYEIRSNFYITPQYFFVTNALPIISLADYHCYSNRITIKGTYSQAQNIMIKKYKLKLYWSNNSGFWDDEGSSQDIGMRTRLMEETDDIYSQNIEYAFWNPYNHDEFYTQGTNDYYKIICECTTQNNVLITVSSEVIILAPQDHSQTVGVKLYDFKAWWDKEKGCVFHGVRGYGSGGGVPTYELIRKDLDSGEIVKLRPQHYTTSGEYGQWLIGYDITASTHARYEYTLMGFDNSGAVILPTHDESCLIETILPSATIEINECSYYITELDMFQFNDTAMHPNEEGTKVINFDTGDTWQFMCEIENTTVVSNLDRITHVGYSQYIASTSTDVNYMSGTLSAMLGTLNCAEKKFIDDISIVRAWRKFITQPKAFLLKSQKGDVWVVNITDNPQTTYEESYWKILTTFTFSWAECMNILEVNLLSRIY